MVPFLPLELALDVGGGGHTPSPSQGLFAVSRLPVLLSQLALIVLGCVVDSWESAPFSSFFQGCDLQLLRWLGFCQLLTQARVILEEGTSDGKCPHQIGLWASLWGMFLMDD